MHLLPTLAIKLILCRFFGDMTGVFFPSLGAHKTMTYCSRVGKIIERFAGIHNPASHTVNFL